MIKDKNPQHHLQKEMLKSTHHATNKKPRESEVDILKICLFKEFFNFEETYR